MHTERVLGAGSPPVTRRSSRRPLRAHVLGALVMVLLAGCEVSPAQESSPSPDGADSGVELFSSDVPPLHLDGAPGGLALLSQSADRGNNQVVAVSAAGDQRIALLSEDHEVTYLQSPVSISGMQWTGRYLVASGTEQLGIFVVEPHTGDIVGHVPYKGLDDSQTINPSALAVSRHGVYLITEDRGVARLVFFALESDDIEVIDLQATGIFPASLCEDSQHLHVALLDVVITIETNTHREVDRFHFEKPISGLDCRDNQFATTFYSEPSARIIDWRSSSSRTIRWVGGGGRDIVFLDGEEVAVVDTAGLLLGCNITEGACSKRRDIGEDPRQLVTNGRYVWATSYAEGTIAMVDTTSWRMIASFDVGAFPTAPTVGR